MKKVLSAIMAIMVMLTVTAMANGESVFATKYASEWAVAEISEAYEKNLIPETMEEKDLSRPVTRGEFAAVSLKLFEALSGEKQETPASVPFDDITGADDENAIKKAYDLKLIDGISEKAFAPDTCIDRQDMAVMLCRTIKKYKVEGWTPTTDSDYPLDYEDTEKFADHDTISDYAIPSVYYLTGIGAIKGVGGSRFAPINADEESAATREQAIALSLRIYKLADSLVVQDKAGFSVSRVFSDNMVLQRGEKIRVWGFADEKSNGKTIYGEFKDMKAEAVIAEGEWCITFPEILDADARGSQLKIYSDEKEAVFNDVLVGDVYMVIGQSNVEANMTDHLKLTDPATHGGGEEAITPDSLIRLNMTTTAESDDSIYPTRGSAEVSPDFLNKKQWTKTTLEDTLPFSALGYYFAREMVEKSENKVPVGVIEFGFSGFPLGSFLPNEVADEFKTDTYNEEAGYYTTTGRNSTGGSGRFVYNRHMYPFDKYAIAGVVWYQGESNCDITEAPDYNKTFDALIKHMRSTHNLVNKDFPVFIVEFPSIYPQPEGYTDTGDLKWRFMEFGMIRSFMGVIPSITDNCYISASSDIWNNKEYYNNLHPFIKYEQAGRLADIAEAVVLGNGDLNEISGPVFKSLDMSEDGMSAVITFGNVGSGLTTCDKATDVKGIVGLSNEHYDLQPVDAKTAVITGKDTIAVTFDKKVRGVAYNFRSSDYYTDTLNLCNSFGNPATGFCEVTEEKLYGAYSPDTFINYTDESLGLLGKDFELLKIDGVKLFPARNIDGQLKEVNNTITISESAKTANVTGWIGLKYETLLFGYSIDGADAVFNTYNTAARQSDLDNGGQYAKRFLVDFDISDLSVGEHTVTIAALVKSETEIPVELLTFNVIVTEDTENE
ncbi:MAG: S-layer homology domain-containing protein [Clostridia bacterium]|nr:S-layer homology domain-containing protein [Clostridia bacterium]